MNTSSMRAGPGGEEPIAVDSAIESSDHALYFVDPAPAAYLTF